MAVEVQSTKKAAETPSPTSSLVYKVSIVVDTHIDTTMMLGKEGWDFMVRHSPVKGEDSNHVDLPRIKEGGLDAAFFSIYMPGTITGPEAVKRSLILIDHVRKLAEDHPNEIVLATTAAEVRAEHKVGKFAALMGMEGGHMIDDSLAVLRDYQRLGVRYLTLSHSVNTNWSDSSGDTPTHNGLTDFGKDVVRELNRLGMLVDISHVSDKTFWDALETSKAPLVASHSSLRSISGHPRNMTDDMIRAPGGKGGVIMINYSRSFLSGDPYRAGLHHVPGGDAWTVEGKAHLGQEMLSPVGSEAGDAWNQRLRAGKKGPLEIAPWVCQLHEIPNEHPFTLGADTTDR